VRRGCGLAAERTKSWRGRRQPPRLPRLDSTCPAPRPPPPPPQAWTRARGACRCRRTCAGSRWTGPTCSRPRCGAGGPPAAGCRFRSPLPPPPLLSPSAACVPTRVPHPPPHPPPPPPAPTHRRPCQVAALLRAGVQLRGRNQAGQQLTDYMPHTFNLNAATWNNAACDLQVGARPPACFFSIKGQRDRGASAGVRPLELPPTPRAAPPARPPCRAAQSVGWTSQLELQGLDLLQVGAYVWGREVGACLQCKPQGRLRPRRIAPASASRRPPPLLPALRLFPHNSPPAGSPRGCFTTCSPPRWRPCSGRPPPPRRRGACSSPTC
jgi:hypothetical protein